MRSVWTLPVSKLPANVRGVTKNNNNGNRLPRHAMVANCISWSKMTLWWWKGGWGDVARCILPNRARGQDMKVPLVSWVHCMIPPKTVLFSRMLLVVEYLCASYVCGSKLSQENRIYDIAIKLPHSRILELITLIEILVLLDSNYCF